MSPVLRDAALAILLGGGLGVGLWSMLAVIPRFAAPRLIDRIAPYIRDVTDPAGTTVNPRAGFDPGVGLIAVARAGWHVVRIRAVSVLGGAATVTGRLERAGWRTSVEAFRGREVVAILVAAAGGAVAAVIATRTTTAGPTVFVLPLVTGLLGYVAVEAYLTRAIARRRGRIEDELPTLLDFLALCLSAGEGLPDALRRTAAIGTGALAQELRRALRDSATGMSLVDALGALAARTGIPAVTRAIDQLIAAVERGAPLSAVLRDQASDARDEYRRSLLEASGRKEIAMLFPLVFLILPLSVLLAVFPGIHILRMGLG